MAVCFRTLRSSARAMSTVGFIGLGNMGGSMAKNMVKGGKDVVVYDVNEASVSDLMVGV